MCRYDDPVLRPIAERFDYMLGIETDRVRLPDGSIRVYRHENARIFVRFEGGAEPPDGGSGNKAVIKISVTDHEAAWRARSGKSTAGPPLTNEERLGPEALALQFHDDDVGVAARHRHHTSLPSFCPGDRSKPLATKSFLRPRAAARGPPSPEKEAPGRA